MSVSLDEERTAEHTEVCCRSRPHLVLQHHFLHTVHGQSNAGRVSAYQLR